MSWGLHTLSVKLLLAVQSLNLSRVNLVHLLESVLGKTGLLGGELSGLVKLRELLFVHGTFLEDPLLLSLTLHCRRKTGDLRSEELLCEGWSSRKCAFNFCLARREGWASW